MNLFINYEGMEIIHLIASLSICLSVTLEPFNLSLPVQGICLCLYPVVVLIGCMLAAGVEVTKKIYMSFGKSAEKNYLSKELSTFPLAKVVFSFVFYQF